MKGKTLRKTIENSLSDETSILGKLRSEQKKLESEYERLLVARQGAIKLIAQCCLGRSGGGWVDVQSLLAAAGEKVTRILRERADVVGGIAGKQALVEKEIQELTATIAELDPLSKEAKAEVVRLQEFTKAELGASFADALNQFDTNAALLAGDGERLVQITEECRVKLLPYESDVVFSALLKRHQEGGIRGVFSWLARKVHFKENLESYSILTNLPAHVAETNAARAAAHEEKRAELAGIWKKASVASGLLKAEKAYEDGKAVIGGLHGKKQKAEGRLRSILSEIGDLNSGQDQYMKEAEAALVAGLSGSSLASLRKVALASSSEEDNALVEKLTELDSEIEETKKLRDAKGKEASKQEAKTSRVEELLRDIRRKDYDSSDSKIDMTDVALGALLGNLMSGQSGPREILTAIGRKHSEESSSYGRSYGGYSSSSSSSSSWSSSSSSSGFGGGSSDSGGSFGGGDCSTGGSF